MRTKISRWGNSLALRIPAALAKDAVLAEGSAVELTVTDGQMRVTPIRQRRDLDPLVAAIQDENRHQEIPWGQVAGREVW